MIKRMESDGDPWNAGYNAAVDEANPKIAALLKALREIGQIAVEPGADAMKALQEAQDIAETARAEVGDV